VESPDFAGVLLPVVYMAIKVLGYAGFASLLNHSMHSAIPVWTFGAAKAVIGLVFGLVYLGLFAPELDLDKLNGLDLYLAALPVRLVAWVVTIDLFLGLSKRPLEHIGAVLVGTAWTFGMDWLLDLVDLLPGVRLAFC
jgi:hypothetical protein